MKSFSEQMLTIMQLLILKDVAMALNNGDADYGVLPIENSSGRDVTGVYDILLENDVCMVG